MSLLLDALICGWLSALVWAGLIWMSPHSPILGAVGWLQGGSLIAIANFLTWLLLVGLQLDSVLYLWSFTFFVLNALTGLLFRFFQEIRTPALWAVLIHPIVISTINVLLGGALGAI